MRSHVDTIWLAVALIRTVQSLVGAVLLGSTLRCAADEVRRPLETVCADACAGVRPNRRAARREPVGGVDSSPPTKAAGERPARRRRSEATGRQARTPGARRSTRPRVGAPPKQLDPTSLEAGLKASALVVPRWNLRRVVRLRGQSGHDDPAPVRRADRVHRDHRVRSSGDVVGIQGTDHVGSSMSAIRPGSRSGPTTPRTGAPLDINHRTANSTSSRRRPRQRRTTPSTPPSQRRAGSCDRTRSMT